VVLNGETISFTNGASILSITGINISTGNPEGSGDGGSVTIQGLPEVENNGAQSVTLIGGQIFSATFGPGRGGDILITSGAVELKGSSITSSANDSVDAIPGAGGNITLNLNALTLTDFSSILSSSATLPSNVAFGSGGNVLVQGLQGDDSVSQLIHLSGNSAIGSQTGNAAGGQVTLSSESVELYGGSTVFGATSETGLAGNIELNVNKLSLSAFSTVKSRTELSSGDAGAGGKITVQGVGGDGTSADSLFLSGEGSIESTSFGTGSIGSIVILANAINLTEGASIQAGTQQDSAAVAGSVTIGANTIDISGGSRIASQVFAATAGKVSINADQVTLDNGSIETSTGGVGRAGNVEMQVGNISLTHGSSINSASTGTEPVVNVADGTTQPPGQAGNITITATGSFTSDASSIATSAEANRGGDISITAQSVGLSNGTLITANSKAPLVVTKLVLDQDGQLVEEVVGSGNAGNITAHSGSTFVMNNSSMTTEATQASGGQVVITAPEMVQLSYSKISTSVAGSAVDTAGGNITIDPQFVVLQNSQIIAQAFAGAGGAIDIIATSAFIADPVSIVSASSTLGISGTVNIQSPLQNVGGELTALTQEFSSAAALLAQQCAARAADGKFSTFVVAAREGLPAEPGGFLASPSLTGELLGSHLSGRDPQPQLLAVTGLFPTYDAKPIQLAKLGSACHR